MGFWNWLSGRHKEKRMVISQQEKETTAAELAQILDRLPSWDIVDDFPFWVEFRNNGLTAVCVDRQPTGWIRVGTFNVSEEGVARAIVSRGNLRLAIYYKRTDKSALPEIFFIESYPVNEASVWQLGLQPYQASLSGVEDRTRFFSWYRDPNGRKPSADFDFLFYQWLPELLEKIATARDAWISRL